METLRRILALGRHDFTARPADRAVCELMLRLATARAGGAPRICLLRGPGADASPQVGRFHAGFGERACRPSDLSLSRPPQRFRDRLLAQDLIYVGAGAGLGDLLAGWRAHDLGETLRLAWRRGIVLAGQGAGATCWFEAGFAESSGEPRPGAGLGLLSGSLCSRYGEPDRRAAYLDAVRRGMPGGYGVDDHAALLWEGAGAPTALTARRGARAYRVEAGERGVTELALAAKLLAAPAPAALREDIAEFRRVRRIRERAGRLR